MGANATQIQATGYLVLRRSPTHCIPGLPQHGPARSAEHRSLAEGCSGDERYIPDFGGAQSPLCYHALSWSVRGSPAVAYSSVFSPAPHLRPGARHSGWRSIPRFADVLGRNDESSSKVGYLVSGLIRVHILLSRIPTMPLRATARSRFGSMSNVSGASRLSASVRLNARVASEQKHFPLPASNERGEGEKGEGFLL